VWSTDITYIPMHTGFMYLVAVMDWYSRRVLSWELSNTLSTQFCVDALDIAFNKFGVPEIFNTDQGSQFTRTMFQERLTTNGVRPSMDGRGRALDNVFIERLWRSVKYENVYINCYSNGMELFNGLRIYFDYYNYDRPHQGMDGKTPDGVYCCTH
jgi:putative transposase